MRLPQLAAFALLAFIWGTTWLAIKYVVREAPPLPAAGVRFALASLLLAAFARWRGRRLHWRHLRPPERRLLLALSVLMFAVPYALVFYGEQFITSALTAILFSSAPAFALLFDSLYLRRNLLTGPRLGGLVLAFTGILIIFWPRLGSPSQELLGSLAILGAAAISSWGLVLAKHNGHDIDTLVGTTWQMGGGAVWLLLAGFLLQRPVPTSYSPPAVLGLLYLAVFGSCVTFVLFYGLLKKMAPVQLSSLAFITPVVAVFVGWLMLDEVLGVNTLLGAAVALGGVALLHRPAPESLSAGD
ncbi:MAG: DMT family transporter [Terriglobia bacterium]